MESLLNKFNYSCYLRCRKVKLGPLEHVFQFADDGQRDKPYDKSLADLLQDSAGIALKQ